MEEFSVWGMKIFFEIDLDFSLTGSRFSGRTNSTRRNKMTQYEYDMEKYDEELDRQWDEENDVDEEVLRWIWVE